MKSQRHIAILLLILFTSLGAAAQQSVESAIKSLENSKSVTNEVYSEKRNPSDKSIIRSDRMFDFTDQKIANKIIEAIRKERNKASAFQMNTRAGNAVYTITFDNGKGPYAKYTLMQRGDSWMLAIVKASAKARKYKDSSFLQVPADAFKSLHCLDNLGNELESLKQLEQLDGVFNNLRYDYCNEGNTISISFSDCAWDDTPDSGNTALSKGASARQKAEFQRKQAEFQRKQADFQRKQADFQRKQAEFQRKLAEKQRKEAEKRREYAKRHSQSSAEDTSFYTVSYTRD